MALMVMAVTANCVDSSSYATGNVTFIAQYPVLQEPVDIPKGTVVFIAKEANYSDIDGMYDRKIRYMTTENATIDLGQTEVTVPCQAVEPGPESNIGPGELYSDIWMYMISSIVNRDPIRKEETNSSSIPSMFCVVPKQTSQLSCCQTQSWSLSLGGVSPGQTL